MSLLSGDHPINDGLVFYAVAKHEISGIPSSDDVKRWALRGKVITGGGVLVFHTQLTRFSYFDHNISHLSQRI
jgi:hypothetical protein